MVVALRPTFPGWIAFGASIATLKKPTTPPAEVTKVTLTPVLFIVVRNLAVEDKLLPMPNKLRRPGIWVGITVMLILLTAAAATWLKHVQEVDTVSDEQKIARTLEIIRTSTPTNHKVLKVLFYGQSITRSGWHNAVVAHWREKYPDTVFVVQNRALGGFASQSLVRTTAQDVAAFYPDLIIFHVYGDHRAYEKILRMFRSLTAADVILQTDHGDVLPDMPCTEGLSLSLYRKSGCVGILWVHQRLWHDEMSYHKIPALGKKYGMAVEPQHQWWRDYLLRMRIPADSLLRDDLHPNDRGNALIAEFFNQYFDNLVERWSGQTEDNVISIPGEGAKHSDQTETVNLDGSRLELFSSKPLAAWPSVTIDGDSPTHIDGCYQATRTSSVESVPDWPALRRITLLHDHTAEDWTATVTNITPDQTSFTFTVKSTTGDEGSGNSSHNFISKSGRLSIEGEDWMFEPAYTLKHVPLQVPAEVHWSVRYVCGGEPEVIDLGNGLMQYRYVLGTGLSNGKHEVKLSFPPNDLANTVELRAYKPPLHKD
jgi:hypothetical protein